MRAFERISSRVSSLPGPLWVFGAWAVYQFVSCSIWNVLFSSGGIWFRSQNIWSIAVQVAVCFGGFFPLFVLWAFISPKRYALPLAKWYATGKAVIYFLFPLWVFVQGASERAEVVYMAMRNVALCAVWLVFLVYLEKSRDMGQLYPPDERRMPWWIAVLVALSVASQMLAG